MIKDILNETDNSFHHSSLISSGRETTSPIDVSRIRTSVNTFVEASEFDRLVEHLTGLEVTNESAAERVQVAQYVYGRMYAPHPDAMTVRFYQKSQTTYK
jgi:hypothetical protein